MARPDADRRSLLDAIFDFYGEVAEMLLLTLFGPTKGRPQQNTSADVKSLSTPAESADDPLELPSFLRHVERRTREGSRTKREVHVSDEFLAQLEQRTQQVKITLANLEADKVRIEGLIAQLQPIIPHYDALVAAERQISEAHISLESTTPADPPPPAEGSGWSSDAPGGEEPPAEGEQPAGWSGSWNS